MIKFSKEEIELCRKIAEKERKEIKYGDWVVINFPYLKEAVTLFGTEWTECPNRFPDCPALYSCSTDEYYKDYFPLWTLSDCLEWLMEKVGVIEVWRTGRRLLWFCRLKNHKWWSGKTPLEACLKAVLAVLEEG